MSPRETRIAAALLFSLLLACAGGGDEAASADPPAAPAGTVGAGGELIGPAAPPAGAYTLLDSATVDLDGDGTPERVELSASVEVDGEGRPLWEDGHRWLVLVRDGEAAYPLLEEFVPWGGAAFWVLESDTGGPPAILVETRSRFSDRVGIAAASFRYDAGRGGFVREGGVDVSGTVLHGDPARMPVLVPDSSPSRAGG